MALAQVAIKMSELHVVILHKSTTGQLASATKRWINNRNNPTLFYCSGSFIHLPEQTWGYMHACLQSTAKENILAIITVLADELAKLALQLIQPSKTSYSASRISFHLYATEHNRTSASKSTSVLARGMQPRQVV